MWKLVRMCQKVAVSISESNLLWLRAHFFKKIKGVKCLVQKYILADLLVSQEIFEILQTSLTVENIENVVKMDISEKMFAMESAIFFKMKDGCKVSCVKILILC